jgi:glutaredoxin
MKIEFYRTIICPRCLFVSRILKKIVTPSPHLELEIIEVATNLTRTWMAGVYTVPTIKIGSDTLTGLIITPRMIRSFIEQHMENDESGQNRNGY